MRNLTLVPTPLEELSEWPDPAGDLHDQYRNELERARLRRSLRALPVMERRVIELRYGLEDGRPHSIRQIANRLCFSIGRAWYLEQRALGMLRESYGLATAPTSAEAA